MKLTAMRNHREPPRNLTAAFALRSLCCWKPESVVCTKPYLVAQVTWLEDRPSPSTVNGDGTVYMASADGRIKVWRREGEAKGHKFDGGGGAVGRW
ncbi:hypothetical protein GYH30_028237 [Glycine max]|nr:hypothetical protein GYH30_028237 [Glycine max]